MFYEEMMIDGEWHYRTTPDGEWRKGRKSANTPAPISVERFDHNWKSDSDGWPISYMEPFRYGEYVRHSDYVALLQQLAERDAALEREQGVREDAQRQLRAAERAREEAERDALRYRWVRACDRKGELAIHVDTMCEGELLGMEQLDAAIDAFLAASGGA